MTVGTARARPVLMLESGPAAGVAAAAYFAQQVGSRSAISFDMGGTTAKMGLILDGQARVVSEFEAGAAAGSGAGLAKGSGYPVLAAVDDGPRRSGRRRRQHRLDRLRRPVARGSPQRRGSSRAGVLPKRWERSHGH